MRKVVEFFKGRQIANPEIPPLKKYSTRGARDAAICPGTQVHDTRVVRGPIE